MVDVDEVYKIPSSKLSREVDTHAEEADVDDEKCLSEKKPAATQLPGGNLARQFSDLNLYKSGRFNVFERHVNQLFIRGDNVVTVALADG